MIIAVVNTKGGVGKSTVALQLSIGLSLNGFRPWLVDGDRQESSISAITLRAESGRPPLAASAYANGATLRAQVSAQAGGFDHVIIDAGGRDSSALRAALTVADVALIPFVPRSFEVWAVKDISELIDEARAVHDLKALAFMNLADVSGPDNRDAAAALREFSTFDLLDCRLTRRKAFANAAAAGLHVDEMQRRDTVACAEAERLLDAVLAA
ncbi:chromosome partitioning protein ParA [Burkholderia thailandensis]|uniref:AAA family ATPase n=1 Tax=Burkholderia thailandensis TaxID=57975 RepID=UPI00148EBF42|nr:AAA family ATPase [Burkholderia thailandensis]NOK40853.1 chromosome partitioning protein ParA [Burkholderia thailandensis]NOK46899.1 AAA family ATPase [Burkholderia thailandensis]